MYGKAVRLNPIWRTQEHELTRNVHPSGRDTDICRQPQRTDMWIEIDRTTEKQGALLRF